MYWRLARFAVVGVIATMLHALTAYLFLEYTEHDPILINTASYILALTFSVVAHSKWTFCSLGATNMYRKVLMSSLFTFALSNVLIHAVVKYVSYNNILIVGCILLASVINFFIINHFAGQGGRP